jgi:hypothetical protein
MVVSQTVTQAMTQPFRFTHLSRFIGIHNDSGIGRKTFDLKAC